MPEVFLPVRLGSLRLACLLSRCYTRKSESTVDAFAFSFHRVRNCHLNDINHNEYIQYSKYSHRNTSFCRQWSGDQYCGISTWRSWFRIRSIPVNFSPWQFSSVHDFLLKIMEIFVSGIEEPRRLVIKKMNQENNRWGTTHWRGNTEWR